MAWAYQRQHWWMMSTSSTLVAAMQERQSMRCQCQHDDETDARAPDYPWVA